MFRLAIENEADEVYDLILKRIKWMNENNIKGWNTTNYLNAYPREYYHQEADKQRLYVLEEDHQIIAAGILLEADDRWPDQPSAYYLHNFVASVDHKGAGEAYLREVIKYAKKRGKKYLRLDSARGNEKLEEFYKSFGFIEKGNVDENRYHGVLRELIL